MSKPVNIPRVALLIDQSRAYERKLMAGIARYIQLHGPWRLYHVSPLYVSGQKQFSVKDLTKWAPDGIIVRETFFSKRLLELDVPVFYSAYDKVIADLPGIYANSTRIAQMGADYFINKGYRNFAFCSLEGYYWSEDRKKVYIQYLQEKGFGCFFYDHPRHSSKNGWQEEPLRIASWLRSLPKPLALMTATDELSLQVVEAAKIADLMIPEEIALLGVDNDEALCNTTFPTLSSIDQNPEWAGFEVARILDKMMNGKLKKKTDVIADPLRVVTRHSTDILAISDTRVASALHFINEQARDRAVSVEEVARHTGLSRRMLEI